MKQKPQAWSTRLVVRALLITLTGFVTLQLSAPDSHAEVEVLYDNSDAAPVIPLIQKAKRTIDIEIYEMQNLKVMEALKSAVQRGVKLRIVKDGTPVNTDCPVFEAAAATDDENCIEQKKFKEWVRANGGHYVPFNKKDLCDPAAKQCFEHGKLLIADQKIALISTGNYNVTSFCDKTQNARACNRDYTLLTQDPVAVRVLGVIFDHDLTGRPYDLQRIVSSPMAQRLTISPYSKDPLISAIQNAKRSILVQNQYLFEPTFNQALVDAAKRGVKVFVNVSSVCYFKRPDAFASERWTKTFAAFDDAKIASRIFTAKMRLRDLPGYLHAKVLLIDEQTLWVGSVNGSNQAMNINREFGLFTQEPNAVKKFSHKFSADFKNPNSESWQESLQCKFDTPPATERNIPAFPLDFPKL
jgi:cardiolipin synthase A/B